MSVVVCLLIIVLIWSEDNFLRDPPLHNWQLIGKMSVMLSIVSFIRGFTFFTFAVIAFAILGTVVYAEHPDGSESTPTPIVITITESISVSDQPPNQDANKTIDESITVNDEPQVSGTSISEVITVSAVVTPVVESLPTATPVPAAVPVKAKTPEKEKEMCSSRLTRDQKEACTAAMGSLEKCEGGRLSAEQKEACSAAQNVVAACTDVETKDDASACSKAMKEAESAGERSEKPARDDAFSRSTGTVAESGEETAAGNGMIWGVISAIVATVLLALIGTVLYRRKRSQ
jgi:hypothetical protein